MDSSSSSPSASTQTTALGANLTKAPPALPPTDTLHFAASLGMLTKSPTATEPNQTALPYTGPSAANPTGNGLVWNYFLQSANVTFTAYEAHIWVRVVETLNGLPPPAACGWTLLVQLYHEPANGDGSSNGVYANACSSPDGPTVAAGDYELVFKADAPLELDATFFKGEKIQLHLQRDVFSPSQNAAVFVLSGAKDFDSRIQFTGLSEPQALR